MDATVDNKHALKGVEFLVKETPANEVFTPEDFNEEQRMIREMAEQFVTKEVSPVLDRIDKLEEGLMPSLLDKAGELGLLGAAFPEEYGGLGKDFVTATLINEALGAGHSFSVAMAAHTGIGSLPILYFGTEAQKQKYIPSLASGQMKGAYALTEPNSGSDALSAKTTAKLSDDGKFYLLNGQKCWITNSGFADVFTVFAKIDGEHFTAFIVEKTFPGVSAGKEEHKMGLHGSSTTPILLQDAKVPADNILGEVGKGHKVALNTLNFGRFKLGGMSVGGCRAAIGISAAYAVERKQFGHSIASFGAIRHKIGEMTARTYAIESLVYRTAGLIDAAIGAGGGSHGGAVAQAFEEYAVEASIAKVAGTETLDYVLDENVQIHGGNGFVKDYSAERYYRDARVNRIFEGTNEINRLLIPGMLIRRALKGDFPLIAAARRLQDDVLASPMPSARFGEDRPLDEELRSVAAFKKVVLMVVGTAMQTYGEKLNDEQEVLGYAADILIETYAAESAVLRARAADTTDRQKAALHEAAARCFVNDAAQRVDHAARSALAAMAEGDTLRTLLAALRRVLKTTPVNTVGLRRQLADATFDKRRYIFDR
jgi:hypothetical protein